MLCVPGHILGLPYDACSCEFQASLYQDSDDGQTCFTSKGSYTLIAIWSVLSLAGLLAGIWITYVIMCAKSAKLLKADSFTAALILTWLSCFTLCVNRVFRDLVVVAHTDESYAQSILGMTFTDVIMAASALIASAFTCRVMFTALLQLIHIPFDDNEERLRNFKAIGFVVLYALVVLPTRFLGLYAVSSMAGTFIAVGCWREFRRIGNNLYEGWSLKMMGKYARDRFETNVHDIRGTLATMFRILLIFFLGTIVDVLGFYLQRCVKHTYAYHMLNSLGETIEAIAFTMILCTLVFVLTSIVQYRMECAVRMQTIATASFAETANNVHTVLNHINEADTPLGDDRDTEFNGSFALHGREQIIL
jgi:hypothetical protein